MRGGCECVGLKDFLEKVRPKLVSEERINKYPALYFHFRQMCL